MSKILQVAKRDFLATVGTRGFLIGLLLPPALLSLLIFALPRLMDERSPSIEGELAIVDPTGQVADSLRAYLAPEAIAARRAAATQRAMDKVKATGAPGAAGKQAEVAIETALGSVPKLHVQALPVDADIEREKEPLKDTANKPPRLVLVVVQPNAVLRNAGERTFGAYDLYVRGKLDDRVENEIRDALHATIVEARVRATGLDRAEIEALTQVRRQPSITVTATGERATNEIVNAFLPFAFMGLIMLGVMTSGQSLMTSMVEEKSNRVIEVLLSAVSPMQLMAGKILGQLGVGALLLAVYIGLGMWALLTFAVAGLLDPMLFVYMVIYFVLAYIMIGSIMAAIGASVNQLSEAQTLMTPVMMLVMIPYMLWLPITRNPNSTFSVIVSMVPPVNCFTMMLRLTSSTPPPAWQVWLSILLGILGVFVAVWFASKVFRVGLLMYGKPPNFATLVRWSRMA